MEYGATIVQSASVMERMINDLLDYTRTRLGAGMPVHPTSMDLASLCRDLIHEYRTANPGREIKFSTVGDVQGCGITIASAKRFPTCSAMPSSTVRPIFP